MPARRVLKSKDNTPAVSDSEETSQTAEDSQQAAAAPAPSPKAPAKKGKLRKSGADQQQQGPPSKRPKRSASNTPEPSDATQQTGETPTPVSLLR